MNRRDFVKAGLSTLGSVPFAHAASPGGTPKDHGPTAATTEAEAGLEIDFTGLFAFELGPSERKLELRVVLVNAKKAKLNDAHVPLLMMPLDRWSPIPRTEGGHIAPSIVNFGTTPMAIWSLVSSRLWVASSHHEYEETDCDRDFTFDDTPVKDKPQNCNDPKEWRSRHRFASLKVLVNRKATEANDPLSVDPKKVAAVIRLTRGIGAGRMPQLACERNRVYTLGDSTTERAYATQMYVTYGVKVPVNEDHTVIKLGITDLDFAGKEPYFIGVKVKARDFTPVTIMNLPLTHGHDPHHYTAFYELVGEKGKKVIPVDCKPTDAAAASGRDTGPNAPDPDCIPPSL